MKTLLLTACGALALFMAGCDHSDADFSTSITVVAEKSQNSRQQENHVALYTITCHGQGSLYKVKIVMPENFAEVNQHFYFNGTNMFAGPMELESNIKR